MFSFLASVPALRDSQRGVKGSGKCTGLGLRASSPFSPLPSFVTLGKSLSLLGLTQFYLSVTRR